MDVRAGRSARGHLQDQRLHQERRDQPERVHHADCSGELSGGGRERKTHRLRCCSGLRGPGSRSVGVMTAYYVFVRSVGHGVLVLTEREKKSFYQKKKKKKKKKK